VSLELRVVAECEGCHRRRVCFTLSELQAAKAIYAWGWRWAEPGDNETLHCDECVAMVAKVLA
jgi:hypothetical protein